MQQNKLATRKLHVVSLLCLYIQLYIIQNIHTNIRTKSFEISKFSFQFYLSLNQFKLFSCNTVFLMIWKRDRDHCVHKRPHQG